MKGLFSKRWKFAVALSLLIPVAAVCASAVINFRNAPYSSIPAGQGIGISSEAEFRIAAMSAGVGKYRSTYGALTLPVTSTVNIIWADGSTEGAVVVSTSSSIGAVPIPGTQDPAPLNGQGGGGETGSGPGNGNGGGTTPPGNGGGGTGGGGNHPTCTWINYTLTCPNPNAVNNPTA